MKNSAPHSNTSFRRSRRRHRAALLIGLLALVAITAYAAGGGGGGTVDPDYKATGADWALLIFFVCLSTGVSFLCSIAEAVLLTVTPSFVERLKGEGKSHGFLLGEMKENVERPLSVILTLNTIAHTVGAGGTGAMALKVFGNSGSFLFFSAVTWFMAGYTALILFGSEIIPKTIGSVFYRSLAGITAKTLNVIKWPLLPLIWMMEQVTKLISGGRKHSVFSREEFSALADIGEKEGHLDQNESTIVRNLLRFQELNATDIMTPRTVMFALPADDTVGDILAEHADKPFSRIPIYGADRDDILGFVLKSELLHREALDESSVKARDLVNPISAIPSTIRLTDLLETMLDKREHIMLVVGEYGGTAGLVTLEDLVETMLGMEIVDEVDKIEDMQALARAQWKKRAEKLNIVVPDETESEKPPAASE